MPRVPLPEGVLGVEEVPSTRRSLQNCFNNLKDKIISRPGITELATTSRVARGQFTWNGSLYQVASTDLLKITNVTTGAFSVIGTIAGTEPIDTAIGFNTATIVVNGVAGAIYTLDASDTLTDISGNANFVPCTAVAHIDGRFVYVPFSGDPAFFSDVGAAGTVQALSFFDAEELPDKNNTVFNFDNTLYIGGTDSFELFRDTGASPNPFGRIDGSRISNGYIGGLIEYNETFLFLGREKDQDFGIYAIGQGIAPKISNEAIDLILTTYDQDELAAAIGGRLKWRGYDIATFTLARDSFGFYAGNWFILDTVFDGVSKPWGGGFITQFDGKYYTAFDDKIGVFAKVNQDYGESITRIIDTAFEQEDNDYFTCQSIDLGISQGFSSTDGSVALFLSRDNVTYGQPLYRNLGDIGEYAHHLTWNEAGGMGAYDGLMGIRIYTTEDVEFSSSHLIANFRG
jgi:hypothetical protein